MIAEPEVAPRAARRKRLLVPLDLLPAGEAKLPVAEEQANAFDAELILVHVLPERAAGRDGGVSPEESHARAYLESIAHLPEAEAPSAEARALVLELLERITRMLEGLKPKVRKAFVLAQCEGLPHKQIAEQMGLSLRSVERYVADALYHCYVLRYEGQAGE